MNNDDDVCNDELGFMKESIVRTIVLVGFERERQDKEWGEQNHSVERWISILGEEYGELCQAVNETIFDNGPEERKKGGKDRMTAEAVQVAAVACAMIEYIERNYND